MSIAVHAEEVKLRRVYLWDVTLSMTGRAGCPNIWNTVKERLIEEINLIADPSVEIVVIPFQHRALHEQKVTAYANVDGKKKLIDFIRNYNLPRMWVGDSKTGSEATDGNGKTTMTALYAPLKYCLDNVITPDKENILELMTDGVSDFTKDGEDFITLLSKMCDIAVEKRLYTFYVMLTPKAINQKVKTLKTCPRLIIVSPKQDIDINIQELTPISNLVLNTHDDYGKSVSLRFTSSSSAVLKPGYKVRVMSNENPYLSVDAECEVSPVDLSIKFTPQYKGTPDELRALINSGDRTPIILSFSPTDDMKNNLDHSLVLMKQGAHTDVQIIGAPEKKVTIRWE